MYQSDYVILYAGFFVRVQKNNFDKSLILKLFNTNIKEENNCLNCDCFLLNPGLFMVFCHKLGFNRNFLLSCRRFCPNDELFEKLVNTAYDVKDHRVALGGNAPVMARRFALEGADVLLAAKMSKSFNEDSHESIKVTGEDILDDDIHLILVKKFHVLNKKKMIGKAIQFIQLICSCYYSERFEMKNLLDFSISCYK